ncbi:MAG: hypothetical protein NTV43_13680 [Methylococcales bacterium]|nr:hypothetical protein [Methylococcales bacterium]
MSDYKITFAPEVNLTAADFAESWNSIEQYRELSTAQTETVAQGQFDFGATALVVLGGIALKVTTTALEEYVKQAIAAHFKKPQQATTPAPAPERIEVQVMDHPDGTKLVVVVLK